MFAKEDFIEASRKFVCIRIETYESKESEKIVRTLLNGRFANTAFCVFDPHGNEKLSRAGRGPHELVPGRGNATDDGIIRQMNRIAARFKPTDQGEAVLQDFDSFRQALNVASADQRLLVFVNSEKESVQQNLRMALSDKDVVAKFHVDFADRKTDQKWNQLVRGAGNKPGIAIIQSGKFGQDGFVMQNLAEASTSDQILKALKACNEKFATSETRKTYSQHVKEGRRKGVYFENEIPYGEDRDGDGKADQKNRGGRRGQR